MQKLTILAGGAALSLVLTAAPFQLDLENIPFDSSAAFAQKSDVGGDGSGEGSRGEGGGGGQGGEGASGGTPSDSPGAGSVGGSGGGQGGPGGGSGSGGSINDGNPRD